MFGCFMTALWTTAGFALVANCFYGLGYLVDCPIEVDQRIFSSPLT
ncbi:hypothetical protein Syncc8109_1733 [Synechococcus sp. WH 8109]|nr:hypothetical protein Syncc8109_1733 [Synechococcus sp. WH 8109]